MLIRQRTLSLADQWTDPGLGGMRPEDLPHLRYPEIFALGGRRRRAEEARPRASRQMASVLPVRWGRPSCRRRQSRARRARRATMATPSAADHPRRSRHAGSRFDYQHKSGCRRSRELIAPLRAKLGSGWAEWWGEGQSALRPLTNAMLRGQGLQDGRRRPIGKTYIFNACCRHIGGNLDCDRS